MIYRSDRYSDNLLLIVGVNCFLLLNAVMPGVQRKLFLTLRGPNNVSYSGYLTLYNSNGSQPTFQLPSIPSGIHPETVPGIPPDVLNPDVNLVETAVGAVRGLDGSHSNSSVAGKFDGYDQEGAGYYVIAVIMVYGISIVMLIASHIKRRHAKILEDKQIDKYLQDFQIIKEKQDREKYRAMKRKITAKLHFQRAMKRRTYKTIQKSALPAIVVGVPSRSHERLDGTVSNSEQSREDKHFLRVGSFRTSICKNKANDHEKIRHSRSMSLRALMRQSTSFRSSFKRHNASARKSSTVSNTTRTSIKSMSSNSSSKSSINNRHNSYNAVKNLQPQESPETATTSATDHSPDYYLSTPAVPRRSTCSDSAVVITPVVHVSPPNTTVCELLYEPSSRSTGVFTIPHLGPQTRPHSGSHSGHHSDNDLSFKEVARRLSDLSNEVFVCSSSRLKVTGQSSINSINSDHSVRDWYTSGEHDSTANCEEPLINITCQ